MTNTFTAAELRSACVLLSSTALIRLVTEIDDNGPIPPGMLAGTLPDLARHHIRQVAASARTHDLATTVPGTGLVLTAAGSELADVYDASARWARNHDSPTPVCDFTSRIQHTLNQLVNNADPAPEEHGDLSFVRGLLLQWLNAHPQCTAPVEIGLAA